jgi:hypothetical protein
VPDFHKQLRVALFGAFALQTMLAVALVVGRLIGGGFSPLDYLVLFVLPGALFALFRLSKSRPVEAGLVSAGLIVVVELLLPRLDLTVVGGLAGARGIFCVLTAIAAYDAVRLNAKKHVIIATCGVVAVLMVLSYMFVDVIPPGGVTLTRMALLQVAGERLRKEQSRCPYSIAELANLSPRKPKTVDAWGRPITMYCDQDGTITLTSLGADCKIGGTVENRDLVVRF